MLCRKLSKKSHVATHYLSDFGLRCCRSPAICLLSSPGNNKQQQIKLFDQEMIFSAKQRQRICRNEKWIMRVRDGFSCAWSLVCVHRFLSRVFFSVIVTNYELWMGWLGKVRQWSNGNLSLHTTRSSFAFSGIIIHPCTRRIRHNSQTPPEFFPFIVVHLLLATRNPGKFWSSDNHFLKLKYFRRAICIIRESLAKSEYTMNLNYITETAKPDNAVYKHHIQASKTHLAL